MLMHGKHICSNSTNAKCPNTLIPLQQHISSASNKKISHLSLISCIFPPPFCFTISFIFRSNRTPFYKCAQFVPAMFINFMWFSSRTGDSQAIHIVSFTYTIEHYALSLYNKCKIIKVEVIAYGHYKWNKWKR